MSKLFEPFILSQVVGDWKAAPHGSKTQVVDQWAKRLGVATQTLYRELPVKRLRTKGKRLIKGIEKHAGTVAAIKRRPPEHKGEIGTKHAVKLAIDNGLIPEEMADVSIGTFDRIMRDIGMGQRQRRISRFQAERPNELHHVDASSSQYFYIHRQLPNGDFVMKLHAGVAGYKNKPVPIRLRPWIYGLTDDYSGAHVARYVAALGESAGDNMDFLSWAWGQNDDSFIFGLPEKIKGDCGPMMSSEGAPEWFGRLGVGKDDSKPLGKEAHGKIERPWRSQWKRFEMPFFAESEWKKFEITMSELNRRFMIYQEEQNSFKHRYERRITRRQAWQKISLYGGAVAMPEDAIRTAVRRWSRKVDAAGTFSIDNVLYEVKGLHDAPVWVYQGIFADTMMVVDQRTGLKYEVENFVPNKIGEYHAAKDSPHQKAMKAAKELTGMTNTLYVEAQASLSQQTGGKVSQIPTRIKETRQIENPLDIDRLPSMDVALREFQSLTGFILSQVERDTVSALIEENGLSRNFVVNLAMEIQTEQNTNSSVNDRRYA